MIPVKGAQTMAAQRTAVVMARVLMALGVLAVASLTEGAAQVSPATLRAALLPQEGIQ